MFYLRDKFSWLSRPTQKHVNHSHQVTVIIQDLWCMPELLYNLFMVRRMTSFVRITVWCAYDYSLMSDPFQMFLKNVFATSKMHLIKFSRSVAHYSRAYSFSLIGFCDKQLRSLKTLRERVLYRQKSHAKGAVMVDVSSLKLILFFSN